FVLHGVCMFLSFVFMLHSCLVFFFFIDGALSESCLLSLHDALPISCTLYVTLEPCAQCAGAIVLAKVKTLVFGAYDEKAGMSGSVGDIVRHPRLNHRVDVQSGVEAEACAELMRELFAARRA